MNNFDNSANLCNKFNDDCKINMLKDIEIQAQNNNICDKCNSCNIFKQCTKCNLLFCLNCIDNNDSLYPHKSQLLFIYKFLKFC